MTGRAEHEQFAEIYGAIVTIAEAITTLLEAEAARDPKRDASKRKYPLPGLPTADLRFALSSVPRQFCGWSAVIRTARRDPSLPAPQRVHLHLHGVTAEDIAAILARRTQIPFNRHSEPGPARCRITELRPLPFWLCCRDQCRGARPLVGWVC
jgi:hypothetical protein